MTKFSLNLNPLKQITFFSLIILLLNACIVQEDDGMTPQDETVTFQVDVIKMAAMELPDTEGEFLEIYGNITGDMIRGNITESNVLWETGNDAVQQVNLSDAAVTGSATYTLKVSELATSEMQVTADLTEWDGTNNAPDNLGKETVTTPLSNITTSATYEIVLNDSPQQRVRVTYMITRL